MLFFKDNLKISLKEGLKRKRREEFCELLRLLFHHSPF